MKCDIREDGRKRSNAQRSMIRNGNAVQRHFAMKAKMAPSLPDNAISKPRQRLDELRGIDVAGQLHAASTSSLT